MKSVIRLSASASTTMPGDRAEQQRVVLAVAGLEAAVERSDSTMVTSPAT